MLSLYIVSYLTKTNFVTSRRHILLCFRDLYIEPNELEAALGDGVEDGGWVSMEAGSYLFTPFPAEWTRLPCGIMMPDNHYEFAPQNTVAVIHSQPFREGDDTTSSSICGSKGSTNYTSGVSLDDLELLGEYILYVNPNIIGIMIDKSSIIRFTIAPLPTLTRCGY